MKRIFKTAVGIVFTAACAMSVCGCNGGNGGDADDGLLKNIYKDYFPVGAAVKTGVLDLYEDLLPHFNSVSTEYEMKWAATQPSEGAFNFDLSDNIVDWAEQNGKMVRGHCLVWYKALPSWVLREGTTKEVALQRIRDHVYGVLEHFGERAYCWDVVNEALADLPKQYQLDSGEFYRTGAEAAGVECGDWYALCGNDFIKEAFRAADDARKELGLDIQLYYNDYGLNIPVKREACLKMLEEMLSEGIAVDGVGMQAHYYYGDFSMKEFENSVKAYTELGLDVQLTELDIAVYPYSNSVPEIYAELPETIAQIQAAMYGGIFDICRRYSAPWKEGAGTITGVTMWGVADDGTHLDSAFGRKDWPLLFDEEHRPKLAFDAITEFYGKSRKQ